MWLSNKPDGDLRIHTAGWLTFNYPQQYVKAMRLFQDEPKWTPLNRDAEVDVNPHRKSYVEKILKPTAAAN